MKKSIYILTLILAISCSTALNNNEGSIGFKRISHDFGKIAFRKEAVCSFEFSNTGKSQLVIYDVKTSCGCTVPKWTKEPIRSGRTGKIDVLYDASFPGVFHKTIEVFYNGPGSPTKLEIEGEVREN